MSFESTLAEKRARYVPADATKAEHPEVGAEVFRFTYQGQPAFAIFGSRASNPVAYYRCTSEERRSQSIQHHLDKLAAKNSAKAAQRLERAQFQHTLKVGDVLCCEWGYEQTNVDFYQVTKVVTPKTVEIQELAQTKTHHCDVAGYDAMTGDTVPQIGVLEAGSVPRRVKPCADHAGGSAVVLNGRYVARLWNGKPRRFTTYA